MDIMFKGLKIFAVGRVRVMTSIFSGETGLRFARHFKDLGAQVTLLMGPGRARFTTNDWTEMTVRQFWYYDDLAELLEEELSQNKYDIIIHSSAVSDYKVSNSRSGKTPSGLSEFSLALEPTAKLVDRMRILAPDSFLVKFKLQVGLTVEELHDIALNSLKASNAQLIVANDLDHMDGENHVAFVIDPNGNSLKADTKEKMCKLLAQEISSRLKDK
jgi:phosphopantothenoylcysteine synthetase/decarboxylase